MKIFGLRIKSGATNADNMRVMISSFQSTPLAEKTEWFKTAQQREARHDQIKKAVEDIGLVPWLVNLELLETEVEE